MSGGVDSSVVATLLSRKEYDLSAIYMRNWDTRDESGTDHGCEWKKDYADVQNVCKLLDIPCRLVSPVLYDKFNRTLSSRDCSSRSICRESIGSASLNHLSLHGKPVQRQTPTCGAIGASIGDTCPLSTQVTCLE